MPDQGQVVFTALAYTLLQHYLLEQDQAELNHKTPPRVRQEILPTASHVIVYCQNRFEFFTPLEFAQILLSLEGDARHKALEKTRRLQADLGQALRNPRAP